MLHQLFKNCNCHNISNTKFLIWALWVLLLSGQVQSFAHDVHVKIPTIQSIFILNISESKTYTVDDKKTTDSLILQSKRLTLLNSDSARILIDKALALSQKTSYMPGLAEAKRQKGLISYYEVRYTEALNLFIESCDLFRALKDSAGLASALNLIAIIYSDQGLSQKSLEIYNQILKITAKSNIHRISTTYNNIGVTYKDMGNIPMCYAYYLRAINVLTNKGDLEAESQYNNNLGMLFIEMGNADSSMFYIQRGLKLALAINNFHRLSNSYEALASFYFWKKDYKLSLKNYQIALDYAKRIGIVYEISSTARGLSKTYAQLGDYQNAYKLLSLEKLMDDSVKQKDIASRITQIELEKGFQKERDLNEAIMAKNKLVRNIYVIILIAIILITSLVIYNYAHKRKSYRLLKERTRQICLQNAEIQSQAEQLNDLNTLKDRLFSIISHDLRSPLSSLVSVLHLTRSGDFSKDEFYALINEMLENVGHTSTLVENLLKWAEAQQKGIKVAPVNFNLYDAVELKMQLVHNQLVQKNIEIVNDIDLHCNVFADKDMIDLVIRNIISNALKFSNLNSAIYIFTTVDDTYVKLAVQDSGIGISPDNLNALFKSKVFSTRGTNNEKGTGLGLMLCKDFVELNKGTIDVESELGKGSMFVITLPKAKNIS